MEKKYKVCKYCGIKIIFNCGYWEALRVNKYGSFNSCRESLTQPLHLPQTNLDLLEKKYEQSQNI